MTEMSLMSSVQSQGLTGIKKGGQDNSRSRP